jgi:hypothetical protein
MFGIGWWELAVIAVILGIPLLLGAAGIVILVVLIARHRGKVRQDSRQVD